MQVEINKLKNKLSKGKNTGKPKFNTKNKAKEEKSSWFSKRPKESELTKAREWNGIKWYYCHKDNGGKFEGIQRQHTPAACKEKAHIFKQKQNPNQNLKRKSEEISDDYNKSKR